MVQVPFFCFAKTETKQKLRACLKEIQTGSRRISTKQQIKSVSNYCWATFYLW